MSCWIDIMGQPKTKPVPIGEFEAICYGKGPQFAVHSVSMVPELGPADSDQIPIPDLDSLVICPWDRTTAWVFADLFWEDKPYNLCPRSALKRQVTQAAEAGFWPMAGVEPEFITLRYVDGQPVKAFDNDPILPGGGLPKRQAWGYDSEASIDSMGFLGRLIDILGELDWGLKDVVAEGAYSQFELDFGYTHALEMADRLTFLRVLLKEVAKSQGMFVTFMPKPTLGDWRSGAHINFSLQSFDERKNLFHDESAEGGWDQNVFHALGGLLRHGGALDRDHLLDGQLLQGPGAQGSGLRRRRLHLGADPHDLRRQQPLGHAAPADEPLLHREPGDRHVHERLPQPGDDHRRCGEGHQGEARSRPLGRQGPLQDDRGRLRRGRHPAPAAEPRRGGRDLRQGRAGQGSAWEKPCTGPTASISTTNGSAITFTSPSGRWRSTCASSDPTAK